MVMELKKKLKLEIYVWSERNNSLRCKFLPFPLDVLCHLMSKGAPGGWFRRHNTSQEEINQVHFCGFSIPSSSLHGKSTPSSQSCCCWKFRILPTSHIMIATSLAGFLAFHMISASCWVSVLD